jgi:hypothetical protein
VTNKQVTAFDLQLRAGMTLADVVDPTWKMYDFKKTLLGYGDAGQWNFIDQTTQAVSTGSATLLLVGELQGETGDSVAGYANHDLFHGLQWLNPMVGGNFRYPNGINFELTFTSSVAPGWGNLFANSTQTGAERDYEDVVAYNEFRTNTVSVPGGQAAVPVPPSIVLVVTGLLGMGVIRGRKA